MKKTQVKKDKKLVIGANPVKVNTPTKTILLTTAKDGMKYCPKCKTTQPVANFPTDNRRADHLYIYCRVCEAERQYVKHTKSIIKNAEENGYTVLKVNGAMPTLEIDVLMIDVNPTTGRTIFTELAPVA